MNLKYSFALVAMLTVAGSNYAVAQSRCDNTLNCAQLALQSAKAAHQIVEGLSLRGAVIPFALSSCPEGWSPYLPAYGRFIRGIDLTPDQADPVDPDGKRAAGSLQDDTFEAHKHPATSRTGRTTSSDEGFPGHYYASGHTESGVAGKKETRPKNVALLFCSKD